MSQQPPGRAPRVTTQANRFVYASELIETIVNRTLLIHCVQKKTPTQIFFHISMNYLWI